MPRTVQVILAGGLGNQLFEYAAGRALAIRVGGRLTLDLSEFGRDTVYNRIYLLDRFSIQAETDPQNVVASLRWATDRLIRKFPQLASRWGLLDEPLVGGLHAYDPRLLDPPVRRFLSLRGYWQSERYFSDSASVIRRELVPPMPADPVALDELEQIRHSHRPVAVCIRFFREVKTVPADPQHMIAAFREQVLGHAKAEPGCAYFVFTDEPNHFQNPDCLGVPFTLITHRARNEDAPGDLFLLTQCQTFFIGYSSFHWWGAWLASGPEKRVTYLHFPGRPCEGYVPAEWLTVKTPTASLV